MFASNVEYSYKQNENIHLLHIKFNLMSKTYYNSLENIPSIFAIL